MRNDIDHMLVDHIVVQAGGKGSRLGYLTDNKPKALVPVDNLPMLFHLFRKFPDKRFVIIADYKREALREYLACFADVRYQVVDAVGDGTCAGVRQAMELLPDGVPFMFIWSDLILPESFTLPEETGNYVGISEAFPCRWSYGENGFIEEASVERGVAGLFVFDDRSVLADVPKSGEFVRWLSGIKRIAGGRESITGDKKATSVADGMCFNVLGIGGTREYGLLSEYVAHGRQKCRPFNKITVDGETVIKEPVDEQGRKLARLEREWYRRAAAMGVRNIPRIYSDEPLRMERIRGGNIPEYPDIPRDEKLAVLQKLVATLKGLHNLARIPADSFSIKEAYYSKTVSRLSKIRNLLPLADKRSIVVNGRECRNVYYYRRDLERLLDRLCRSCREFVFIHGDCTFSNMMLKDGVEPVLIDPRGYFGFTEMYGDPDYDWAKLYYSVAGNYDRFNLGDFRLTIGDDSVKLSIESNHWEDLAPDLFALSGADPQVIKLLHAVIWLSLTTYAWQDYDSVCGAFYNGLYYLEELF